MSYNRHGIHRLAINQNINLMYDIHCNVCVGVFVILSIFNTEDLRLLVTRITKYLCMHIAYQAIFVLVLSLQYNLPNSLAQ